MPITEIIWVSSADCLALGKIFSGVEGVEKLNKSFPFIGAFNLRFLGDTMDNRQKTQASLSG